MMKPILIAALLLGAVSCADTDTATRSASLGEEAFDNGQYAEAVAMFSKAIQQDDRNPSFYGNRGSAYSYLGKLDEALRDYEIAIKKTIALSGNPKDERLAYFLYNRAYAYEHAGRITEALESYKETIDFDPKYPDAHGNAAWILATSREASIRNPTKAMEYALAETKLPGGKRAGVLDTLAAAYAANGQFDAARRLQEDAVSKVGGEDEKKKFAQRLRLYQQGTAYIESDKK
jgi:tetratricopeptide (TPR) repeat protein